MSMSDLQFPLCS